MELNECKTLLFTFRFAAVPGILISLHSSDFALMFHKMASVENVT
jgi:hypothetical protein